MTAPAAIRQSDLRRVVAMAKESGCTIEVEKDGFKIRVMPDNPDIHRQDPVEEPGANGGNSLSEWRARHESGTRGYPSRQKNTR
jgi:hypothetical protein